MNRSNLQAVFYFIVCALVACPLMTAQQQTQVVSLSLPSQPAQGARPAMDAPSGSVVSQRNQALKAAKTLHICSQTVFLTAGTLDRALMKQKDWDKLGLDIVTNQSHADLELQVNRVVFTHVHTYILTDKATGIVLAAGKVTAFDGVIATGPMAEQIVKIFSAARLSSGAAASTSGL
jgi:hypothetical protein